MEQFTRLTATCCPLELSNIDTDQLLPARYLKVPRSADIGQYLLHDLRRNAAGEINPEFPLNKPAWRDARILLAGRNFGGGSSREAAVYALYDSGIRCVIALSFGDIFSQNAAKNGLLPALLGGADIEEISAMLIANPALPVTIDLEQQTIVCGNKSYNFSIDPTRRERLLNGWDDIGLTESFRSQISAFKTHDRQSRPWVYLPRV